MTGFREAPRRCPRCAKVMNKESLPSSEIVDTCSCGVFADYFDGDPRAISLALAPPEDVVASEEAPHTCAACGLTMELLSLDGGPALYRCHECASVFMTPAMLRALRRFEESAPPAPRTLLQRIAAWFDAL